MKIIETMDGRKQFVKFYIEDTVLDEKYNKLWVYGNYTIIIDINNQNV